MSDYKQGKIYTIRCNTDDTLIYLGSTTEALSTRMARHRYDSINKPTICIYQYINDWNDWCIDLYENYPYENKEHLNKTRRRNDSRNWNGKLKNSRNNT